MRRPLLIAGLATAVLVGGLDLASRLVLGKALVDLADQGPRRPAVPTAPESPREAPLLTIVAATNYSVLAIAPADCSRGPTCTITLTVEPAPGFRLNLDAPLAFVPTPNAAFAYDSPSGRLSATHPTPSRAVIAVPTRLMLGADDTPRTLEGKVRLVTCNADVCYVEQQMIAIELPPRLPSG